MKPFGFRFTKHAALQFTFILIVTSGTAAPAQTTRHATATHAGTHSDPERLTIPARTILPVILNQGLSTKNSHVGQTISGRLAQTVP